MLPALTPRQQQFCDEYLLDSNGQQAAIRTGYSPKTAARHAWNMLQRPAIKAYIAGKQAALTATLNLKTEALLKEYVTIAFFNVQSLYDDDGKLIPLHQLPPHIAAAVESIDIKETYTGTGENRTLSSKQVKVKPHSKLDALNALAKHLGLFEKHNQQQQQNEDNRTVVFIGDMEISRV